MSCKYLFLAVLCGCACGNIFSMNEEKTANTELDAFESLIKEEATNFLKDVKQANFSDSSEEFVQQYELLTKKYPHLFPKRELKIIPEFTQEDNQPTKTEEDFKKFLEDNDKFYDDLNKQLTKKKKTEEDANNEIIEIKKISGLIKRNLSDLIKDIQKEKKGNLEKYIEERNSTFFDDFDEALTKTERRIEELKKSKTNNFDSKVANEVSFIHHLHAEEGKLSNSPSFDKEEELTIYRNFVGDIKEYLKTNIVLSNDKNDNINMKHLCAVRNILKKYDLHDKN